MQMQSQGKTILYISDDNGYLKAIRGRFEALYQHLKFNFVTLWDKPDNVHKLFLKCLAVNPNIIYIDLSAQKKTQFKLARLICRENSLKEAVKVVLVDNKKSVLECRTLNANYIHIKCGEYSDVVYEPYYLAWPKEAKKSEYAKAKVEIPCSLLEDFKVGYIAQNYLHVEGNLQLKEGQLIELLSAIPPKLIPSKKYITKKIHDSNFYYDFQYSYDLEPVFVDKPEPDQNSLSVEDAKAKYKQDLAEYASTLQLVKKRFSEWVIDHLDVSKAKDNKVLIVDEEMDIYKGEGTASIDDFHSSLRCQKTLSDDMVEIARLRPSMIVFQMKDIVVDDPKIAKAPPPAAKPGSKKEKIVREDIEIIGDILKKVRSIQNYTPFILIFNSKQHSSKSFQDSYKYPFLLANTDRLSIKYIFDLAEMYRKKQETKRELAVTQKIQQLKKQDPVKYRKLSADDFNEKRYVLNKTHELAEVSVAHSVVMTSLTESEVTLRSDKELNLGLYRLTHPTEVGVTLVPIDGQKHIKQGGSFDYRGLLHSFNEVDKKELRRYVNDIFFTDVNNQKEAEKKEFEDKNAEIVKKRERDQLIALGLLDPNEELPEGEKKPEES